MEAYLALGQRIEVGEVVARGVGRGWVAGVATGARYVATTYLSGLLRSCAVVRSKTIHWPSDEMLK